MNATWIDGLRETWRRALPSGVRRRVGLMRRTVRQRWTSERRPWVVTQDPPSTVAPLDNICLYAVIGAWMEGDVVADTVANAFTQGADRVFLVDNDSPDDTVERAVGAGAEHVLTFATKKYDERYRLALMNDFVRYQSEQSGLDHVWWLWIDADEFPRPERGGTIRDLLCAMDGRFRVVGGRFIDHYPTPGRPAFAPGDHPLDHQPLADELTIHVCDQGHRKHPLQRWDRKGPQIAADLGFHRAISEQRPLLEPRDAVVIDHFPFRERSVTERRLEVLWGLSGEEARTERGHFTSAHMESRLDSLEAVYAGDWSSVGNFHPGRPDFGVSPVDWRELRPAISQDVRRWNPTAGGGST